MGDDGDLKGGRDCGDATRFQDAGKWYNTTCFHAGGILRKTANRFWRGDETPQVKYSAACSTRRELGIMPDAMSSSELSRKREEFIDKHSALFWYTPEDRKRAISDELLVETILNEGTLDDFRALKDVLTPKRVAQIFFGATPRQIGNYYPEIRHFFSLVLKEYA